MAHNEYNNINVVYIFLPIENVVCKQFIHKMITANERSEAQFYVLRKMQYGTFRSIYFIWNNMIKKFEIVHDYSFNFEVEHIHIQTIDTDTPNNHSFVSFHSVFQLPFREIICISKILCVCLFVCTDTSTNFIGGRKLKTSARLTCIN